MQNCQEYNYSYRSNWNVFFLHLHFILYLTQLSLLQFIWNTPLSFPVNYCLSVWGICTTCSMHPTWVKFLLELSLLSKQSTTTKSSMLNIKSHCSQVSATLILCCQRYEIVQPSWLVLVMKILHSETINFLVSWGTAVPRNLPAMKAT